MNGNNNFDFRRKKKQGNGIVFLVIALPVVLCIVMGFVFFSFTDMGKNDAPDVPDVVIDPDVNENGVPANPDATVSGEELVTVPENIPENVPETEPENNVENIPEISENGSEDTQTPSGSDNNILPGERPDSPEAPLPENGDNLLEVDTSAWNLILVNPTTFLPEDFDVELVSYNDSHKVDARILEDLKAMIAAMKSEGLSPVVCSSYRTNAKQTSLFERQVDREKAKGLNDADARREAGTVVAVPGTSEHQTGLALDIVALSYQVLDENQENTAEQKWLMENCYDYGFILRYPNDKSHITGIIYEPWHYRYVGKEVALDIKARGITLEEWLDLYK